MYFLQTAYRWVMFSVPSASLLVDIFVLLTLSVIINVVERKSPPSSVIFCLFSSSHFFFLAFSLSCIFGISF